MSFYVILPSNTPVDGNRTNSFRVRLPKTLQFNADWSVGLAVFVYPHSWPSLGADGSDDQQQQQQQFIRVHWKSGEVSHISIPPINFTSPLQLLGRMQAALREGCMAQSESLESVDSEITEIQQRTRAEIEQKLLARSLRIAKVNVEEASANKTIGHPLPQADDNNGTALHEEEEEETNIFQENMEKIRNSQEFEKLYTELLRARILEDS